MDNTFPHSKMCVLQAFSLQTYMLQMPAIVSVGPKLLTIAFCLKFVFIDMPRFCTINEDVGCVQDKTGLL